MNEENEVNQEVQSRKVQVTTNTRSQNWCFTWNHPNQEAEEYLGSLAETEMRYMVFGREVAPSTGTPHLQGQVCFNTVKSFKQVKQMMGPTVHVERTMDLEKSIEYCMKGGDYVEHGNRPMSKSEKGEVGKKMEQERWDEILENAKRGNFDDIDAKIQVLHGKQLQQVRDRYVRSLELENTFEENFWVFGQTGTGKSRWARREYPNLFVKMINKWWDGYDGQDTVLIEDIDPDRCTHLAHYMKTWVDHYPFPAETKGSSTLIRPKRFVVTSNYTIDDCFPLMQDREAVYRRFTVMECKEGSKMEIIHKKGAYRAPAGGTHPSFVIAGAKRIEMTDGDDADGENGNEENEV